MALDAQPSSQLVASSVKAKSLATQIPTSQIAGNDSSGTSHQENIGTQAQQSYNTKSSSSNNNIHIHIGSIYLGTQEQCKTQGILQGLGRLSANLVGIAGAVSAQPLEIQESGIISSQSSISGSSALPDRDVSKKRRRDEDHEQSHLSASQYTASQQLFTSGRSIHHDAILGPLQVIDSWFTIIKQKRFIEFYGSNGRLRKRWNKILRQQKTLSNMKDLLHQSSLDDVILISQSPGGILESIAVIAEEIYRHLSTAFSSKTRSDESQSKRRKVNAPIDEKTASSIGSITLPIHRPPPPQPPPSLPLLQKIDELERSMIRLSALCKTIRERLRWLSQLRDTRNDYTSMFTIMQGRCLQHRHIVDFVLQKPFDVNGDHDMRSQLDFRFCAQSIAATTSQQEVWLRYQSAQSNIHPSTGCLIGIEWPAILDPSSASVSQFTSLNSRKGQGRPLSEVNKELQDEFLVEERDALQLAKRIATAVLNFNSTPWFRTFWTSNDVVMYKNSDRAQNLDEYQLSHGYDPYFRIDLENDAGQLDYATMLFCLGLVLFDLWKYFPGSRDPYPSYDESKYTRLDPASMSETRDMILFRMQQWVSRGEMSSNYERVVQWCIDAPACSFEEMHDPRKMDEMYQMVVCGLDQALEEEKRKLEKSEWYKEQAVGG